MRRYAMRPPAVFWVLLSFALLFPVGWAEAAGCTSISCAVSGSSGPYTTPYGAPIVIAFPIGDYAKDYYDSLLSPTSAGSLVEIGADANNDYVEFVPASGFSGQVSITSQYQRTNTDGGGGNQTIIVAGAAVTVTVLAPTPAPTTSNGSMTAAYNGSGSSTLNIAGSYTNVTLGSPAHGAVTSSGGAGVTYTPYIGFSGTDSFTFSATGPGGASNTSTENVTVGASPPTVGNANLTVAYGTAGQVVAQVSGVYTSVSASNGSHGLVTLNGQTATYTPNSGFYGADSFTISAAGPGGTGTGTINVTVQPPSAPGVGNVYLSVGYGAAGSVGLAISGSYSSINLGSPSHGTASLNGLTVTYTPAAGYYGSDAITYSASGPGGTSGTAQVSITVSPPGGPSITGGSISTPYQTQGSLTLNVSGVYSSITATSPAHGSVAISGTTAAYTPVSGFCGADSFQVSVSGPGGTSGLALVTVTVGLPPAPSVAPGSIGASYDGSGSTVLSVSGVYSLLSVSQPPADGSVSFSGATATYVPNSGYTGVDSFTYTATGPGGVSAPATVNVQVAAPPAPKVAHASISSSYNGSGSTALSVSGVYSLLTVSRAPTHGSVSFSGAMATYVPTSGYYGADTFTYTATGPGGASSPATVSVQVALPPAPTVAPGSISSTYNGSGSTTLSVSGVYTGLAIAQGPVHGSVSLSGSTATYVPDAGYYGADSFTYTAGGPGGVSSSATVSIQVGLPAAPTIAGGSISTSYQTPGLLNLNVSGVESSITATSPAHGSVSISGTTATYTPVSGFYGSDSFQVSASGPGGTSGLALVAVSVGLPPAPAVAAGSISSSYNGSGSTALSVTGVYSLLSVSQAPAHGAVTFSGVTATYVPNGGYYGADSFTCTASGPGGVSPAATVSVQVALPPAPTAAPGSIRSAYNGSGSTALSVSGVYTGLAIAQGPAHGSVALAGTTSPTPATMAPTTLPIQPAVRAGCLRRRRSVSKSHCRRRRPWVRAR